MLKKTAHTRYFERTDFFKVSCQNSRGSLVYLNPLTNSFEILISSSKWYKDTTKWTVWICRSKKKTIHDIVSITFQVSLYYSFTSSWMMESSKHGDPIWRASNWRTVKVQQIQHLPTVKIHHRYGWEPSKKVIHQCRHNIINTPFWGANRHHWIKLI